MHNLKLFAGSKHIEKIEFSPVRKVLNRAIELEREGVDIVHLEIGEPDFDTPQPIVKATIKALEQDRLTHYGPNAGYELLRENIAKRMEKEKGLKINPKSEILVTIGAAEAIFITIMALINPGDEVIILTPAFSNYVNCVNIAGGIPVIVPLKEENEFQIDSQELAEVVTEKTRMIILNNPNNPTGAVYKKVVLEEVGRLAVDHDLLILSDEIYDGVLYEGVSHYPMAGFPGLRERTITINGFSKTYAMTGWRLGYLVADERFMLSFIKLHQSIVTCAPTFLQAGAALGMLESENDIERMVNTFNIRRQILLEGLRKIKGLSYVVPKGAFYAFINIKNLGMKADEFANLLLEKKGVAVVPGTGFGQSGEGYFRISYATSEASIENGIQRVKELVEELV